MSKTVLLHHPWGLNAYNEKSLGTTSPYKHEVCVRTKPVLLYATESWGLSVTTT